MRETEICFMTATSLARRLRAKDLSAAESTCRASVLASKLASARGCGRDGSGGCE
jgi:hypothetical protein